MNSAASAPRPAHCGDVSLPLPRVADVELEGAVADTTWPPAATTALALGQNWLTEPELAFRPGSVGLATTERALLVFAELTDEHIHTTVKGDHEPIYERGDVFEIFLQSFGAEAYFEFQIAPNGHRLQLHYPWIGAVRANGIERYIRRDRLFDVAVRVDPANARWRIAVRVPVGPLLPRRSRDRGAEWRAAFCRYDYDAAGQFCLSSTAALTRPDFHRIGEWSRVSVADGFPEIQLGP